MKTLFLLILPFLFAATESKPVISESGKKRLQENLATLEKNLTEVQTNIDNCKKNAAIVASEAKDLDALEKENLDLRAKYKAQLEATQTESEKNEKALKELEEFQRKIAKNLKETPDAPPAQQQDLLKAQKDLLERERWRNEAKTKIEKINSLLKSANQNLSSIQSRKGPLQEQLAHWASKSKEYEKIRTDLSSKKTQTQKLLKSSPSSTPAAKP